MAATVVLAAAAAAAAVPPGAAGPEAHRAVAAWVEANLPGLLELYRDLHRHPELSLEERRTAALVASRLEAAGYEVITGIGGHGVAAVLRNGSGPTVLLRGDMDALPVEEATGLPYRSTVPGVMHACGHDVHVSVLVGTAAVLAAARDRWRGTVVAVAQPAEELGRGAAAMIAGGLFHRVPRPDACLALHVAGNLAAGRVAYTPGWATANVDSVDVTIHGRGGHGSRPHETVDPVVTAAQFVVTLQTLVSRTVDPVEPAVVTVGSFHAGSKHNVIPTEARLQLTVRSFSDDVRRALLDGIRRIALHTCRAMGCPRDPEVTVREEEFTPSGYNDPDLAARAVAAIREVLGPDAVVRVPPLTVGEDFARYARHLGVPGFQFWLGSVDPAVLERARAAGEPPPPLHSGRYAPSPGPTVRTGVRSLAAAALAVLAPPEPGT